MLLMKNIENMKAAEKKQWIKEVFRRKSKQHLVTYRIGNREEERVERTPRSLTWPLILARPSHMPPVSRRPVSHAGGTEKEPAGWLNRQMNVITGEEIIRKDL